MSTKKRDRPYVIINCAMSVDGKIASQSGEQMRISCDEDIQRMYELRNENDAVLVGINTVLNDNPKLTVKNKYVKKPKQPIRIVLDTDCKTPTNALIVDDKAKTIIVSGKKCEKKYGDNVELMIIDKDKDGLIDLKKFLELLYIKGIKKLMVEGGGTVIWNFLKFGFVDDFFIYVGSIIIGGIKTPTFSEKRKLNEGDIKLTLVNTKRIGSGVILHYRLIK